MLSIIIQMLISISLILGGMSGSFVLRGTDSSAALVAFGLLWLAFDIAQLISLTRKQKKPQPENSEKQRKASSLWLFVLSGIYVVINLIVIFLLVDELNSKKNIVLLVLAIGANVISLAGIVFLLLKKKPGIIIALAGSALSVVFTIVAGTFIVGSIPRFDMGGFIGFMLMSILPGIVLWLYLNSSRMGTSGDDHS